MVLLVKISTLVNCSILSSTSIKQNIFAKLSGIKVNYDKTEALWIGSLTNRMDKLEINQNIKGVFQTSKPLDYGF